MEASKFQDYLGAILILLVALPSAVLADEEFERLVIFGDSLSDSGNAFVLTGEVSVPPYLLVPEAPYARGGMHFSNGQTWVERLAKKLKLVPNSRPVFRGQKKAANYAIGGARARSTGSTDLSTQVGLYLTNVNYDASDDDTLYVVFIGGNDIRDAITALATDPTGATSLSILTDAINSIQGNIQALAAAGAEHFMIANAPDLGVVPAVRLQGIVVQGFASFLSESFNANLAQVLGLIEEPLDIEIENLDIFTLINQVVANPAAFGMVNAQDPCINPGQIEQPTCSNARQYLFWDGIHPTAAGHQIIARDALRVID